MTTASLLVLCALSVLPSQSFNSLQSAFRARQSHGDLPADAVQFVLDSCGLRWPLDREADCPGRGPLVAALSHDRRFCVLARPYPLETCVGKGGVALVGVDSGLVWTQEGFVSSSSAVSSRGAVAMFLAEANPSVPNYTGLHLLIVSAGGDTLLSRRWKNRPYAGMAAHFGDRCAFSHDGAHLLLMLNDQPSTSLVSILYVFDLATGVEHKQSLDQFHPADLEVYSDGAALRQFVGDSVCRVSWSRYRVEVTDDSNPGGQDRPTGRSDAPGGGL